jgi:hypothetical protein
MFKTLKVFSVSSDETFRVCPSCFRWAWVRGWAKLRRSIFTLSLAIPT